MEFNSVVAIGLPFTATAAGLLMAGLVLWGAEERRVARAFTLLAVVLALWNLFIGLQAIPHFALAHQTLIEVLRVSLLIVPAVTFHTGVVWAGREEPWLWRIVWLGYGVGALLVLAQTQGWMWNGWVTYSWGAVGRPGPFYPAFVVYSLMWCAGMVAVVIYASRRTQDAGIRLRLRYLRIAGIVGFVLGETNVLPMYGIPVPPLGGLGCIGVLAVLAYGTLRHRMLEVDVLLIKVATPVLAFVAVLPIALVLVWLYLSADPQLGAGAATAYLVLVMLGMSTYARIRFYVDQAIERSLFPARHRARQAIERFSRRAIELTHRQRLGPELTSTLVEGLGLNGAALYVRDPAGAFRCDAAHGQIAPPLTVPPQENAPAAGDHAGWELVVPVGSSDAPLALIALGGKQSGAAIDDMDTSLLAVVASQIAVALQNIDYVQQIEKQKAAIELQKAEIEALHERLAAENTVLRAEVRSVSGFSEIIGSSPTLQRALEVIDKAARSDVSILITGETGTGKELIARAIHERSERRAGPLISVNCPTIPAEIAEAELFGCERGAFTGATEPRPGRFELADGGTLFLDELADLPLAVQTKLLRVLQEREVQRLGGRTARKIDVRVVAATNRDLRALMGRGVFREDLYHRVAAIVVHLPPLRARGGDIDVLATHFLDRAAATHQKAISGFTPAALRALASYNWPGNIRELQNVVERAVLLCGEAAIEPHHLGDLGDAAESEGGSLNSSLRDEKVRRVEAALLESGGNITVAARTLGMSRSNLSRLLRSLGLRKSGPVQ
jgi:transcriptional regulator with GAF, ATPase, and Fis domain